MLRVEICIKGRFDVGWSEWFGGLEIVRTQSGETILTGSVPDQAALYGLVGKLRDLGAQLVSVQSTEQAGSEN